MLSVIEENPAIQHVFIETVVLPLQAGLLCWSLRSRH